MLFLGVSECFLGVSDCRVWLALWDARTTLEKFFGKERPLQEGPFTTVVPVTFLAGFGSKRCQPQRGSPLVNGSIFPFYQ